MSWRTQGRYKKLSNAEREWLERFNREWDTKAEGRNRVDAYGKSWRVEFRNESQALETIEDGDPILIEEIAEWIVRFTVPKRRKSQWGIYLRLTDGRHLWVNFQDEPTADQAYQTILEICS